MGGAGSEVGANSSAGKRKSYLDLPPGMVECARLTFEDDSEKTRRPSKNTDGSEELARLRSENSGLRRAVVKAKEAAGRMDMAGTAAALSEWEVEPSRSPSPAASSPGHCSEGRLRVMLTSHSTSVDQLRQAILSVESLLQEAKRELAKKEHRERRSAYELLHSATDREDEEKLPEAIEMAKRSGVDSEEIDRAEAKLKKLHSMTDEQRAARAAREFETKQKKEAFILVKKDNIVALEELLNGLPETVRWKDWKDQAGRNLWRFAQDLRSANALDFLGPRFGLGKKRQGHAGIKAATSAPRPSSSSAAPAGGDGGVGHVAAEVAAPASPPRQRKDIQAVVDGLGSLDDSSVGAHTPTRKASMGGISDVPSPTSYGNSPLKPMDMSEEEKAKAKALRAVVQDDGEALEEVLELMPIETISKWENKAGTGLLTLAEERGSAQAYAVLAKAMGMVREMKRDFFEERETVWVFVQGDVQPKRATVLEDTPEESDTVLLEFWDGDEPPERVDRNRIRRMWS